MKGAVRRMILAQGVEYTVRNATGGGGRDTPSYSDDGTVTGILERRSRTGQVDRDSSGTEVRTDLEIRIVPDAAITIREADADDGYPTQLVHPDGVTYDVVSRFPEDSGVTVLTVVRA